MYVTVNILSNILRKSIAFSLLAAYHTYVFFAAALSILTLDVNISWPVNLPPPNVPTPEIRV